MPIRASALAHAWLPWISAKNSRWSKCSEPEKRSKISDGPSSKRPPQSFIRLVYSSSLAILQAGAHPHRQTDQANEALGILLVVGFAHGETGDGRRIQRVRRLARQHTDVRSEERRVGKECRSR